MRIQMCEDADGSEQLCEFVGVEQVKKSGELCVNNGVNVRIQMKEEEEGDEELCEFVNG